MSYGTVTETKVIKSPNTPEEIAQNNAFYGRFLWNVQHVQVSYTKDNFTEEVSSYVTITYQRNKLLPYYDELVALERDYYFALQELQEANDVVKRGSSSSYIKPCIFGMIALVCAFIPFSAAYEGGNPLGTTIWYWILGGIIFLFGIGLCAYSRDMRKEALQAADNIEPLRKEKNAKVYMLQQQADILRNKILNAMR